MQPLHLREKYQINWDPKPRRIRCHVTIIDVAGQAFIFAPDRETIDAVVNGIRQEAEIGDEDDLNSSPDEDNEYDEAARLSVMSKKKKSGKDIGPLGKLNSIVAYMGASEPLCKEFLDAAGRTIPMDNDTRWNCWYTMNTVACELKDHVDTFVKNHANAIGKYALTPDDWDTLREINAFFKPFEKAIIGAQGHLDSIEKTLATMDIPAKHLEKQKDKHANNPKFQNAILMAQYAFDKYYNLTDQVPAYAAALLLHPSRRKRYIDAISTCYRIWIYD